MVRSLFLCMMFVGVLSVQSGPTKAEGLSSEIVAAFKDDRVAQQAVRALLAFKISQSDQAAAKGLVKQALKRLQKEKNPVTRAIDLQALIRLVPSDLNPDLFSDAVSQSADLLLISMRDEPERYFHGQMTTVVLFSDAALAVKDPDLALHILKDAAALATQMPDPHGRYVTHALISGQALKAGDEAFSDAQAEISAGIIENTYGAPDRLDAWIAGYVTLADSLQQAGGLAEARRYLGRALAKAEGASTDSLKALFIISLGNDILSVGGSLTDLVEMDPFDMQQVTRSAARP